jgi:hypothetical protein
MSYTRAQLVTQALLDLGVIAEGQSVSDTDTSKMDGVVDAAMAELAALDIYYVADSGTQGPSGGDIDAGAFLSVSLYLANAACSAFNMSSDEKMKALEIEAIRKLRTLSRPPRSNQRLRIDPILRGGNRGQWARWPNNG